MKLSIVVQRKNVLLTFVILLLIVSMAPVITLAADGDGTLLSVDPISIVDTSLTLGSVFYVDFTIDDVENMWGFEFWVGYNTSVLTATGFGSWSPFDIAQGSPPGGEINDANGYVALRYSYPMGEPNGLTTDVSVYVAWIEFTVDALGWSTLHLYGPPPDNVSKILNVYGSPISHDTVDGFFANVLNFPHDIAVTAIDVSPTRDIMPGESVSINVTVANQAPFSETFNVTAYANTTMVDSESVTIDQMRSTVTQLHWDTTGFAFDYYSIRVEASVVLGETDTADNTRVFDDAVIVGTHDVAVSAVTATPKSVVFGEHIYIDVTVANEGDFTETFSVTTKYGYYSPIPPGAPPETVIETKAVASLSAGTGTTLTFSWGTSDVKFSNSVTTLWIVANVSKTDEPAVPYETNTANNHLQMTGDVTVWTEHEVGRIYIRADGSVDPDTAPISNVDNIIYTFTDNIYDEIVVERDNVVVDGARYTLQAGSGTGIDLTGRSNVTIKNTEIKSCRIALYESSNNVISGNNITNNDYCGVYLAWVSDSNTISGNNIANNGDGIWLVRSSKNVISGNNITNSWNGIWLFGSSGYNTISGNNITENYGRGMYLECSLGGNKIYHNNFIDNTNQVVTTKSSNVWDDGYPSGGNYWIDYTDLDDYSGPYQNETGGDGIWDHPYVIVEDDQDNYPLMEPWSPKTLLGTGWGWMRIEPRIYVLGRAQIYKIEETQIELVITYEGNEYSKTWNIIFHKEYKYDERYLCYNDESGFLTVGLYKHRRWQSWYAFGKGVIAFGNAIIERPVERPSTVPL